MSSRWLAVMLAALVGASGLAIAPARAWAATVDGGAAVVGGPGLGSASVGAVSTTVPNNDDTSGTENAITVTKSFTSVNPIDIQFQVTNSGGITEYRVTETVTNSSPVVWFDYHVELGFGGFASTPASTFQQSGISDEVDFDTCGTLGCTELSPAATSNVFGAPVHAANLLTWSGGAVAPGGSVTFEFSIDLPDSSSCASQTPACPVVGDTAPTGYLFTLREFPTITGPPDGQVPGPATLFLLSSGVAGLGAVGWRRRRT